MSEKNHSLVDAVATAWPAAAWRQVHVLLALSGGADSVALLRSMVELRRNAQGAGQLIAAHFHHGVRGAEADDDLAFVVDLCRQWDVTLEVGHIDESGHQATQRDGWEAAARTARYGFLLATAERLGARWVATAHHAEDQAETVLHRILRGTGLAGLAGIPPRRPLSASVTLMRPLLAVERHLILDYLNQLGQPYRTDSSNADLELTRNRLRHDLLPKLRDEYNSEVDSSLRRLAWQAAEAQALIEPQVTRLTEQTVTMRGDETSGTDATAIVEIQINTAVLRRQADMLVREVCRNAWRAAAWPEQAMSFDKWQQLADLVKDEEGTSLTLPGGVSAQQSGGLVRLLRAPSC